MLHVPRVCTQGCPALESLTVELSPSSPSSSSHQHVSPEAPVLAHRPGLRVQLLSGPATGASFTATRPPGPSAPPAASRPAVPPGKPAGPATRAAAGACSGMEYRSPGVPWQPAPGRERAAGLADVTNVAPGGRGGGAEAPGGKAAAAAGGAVGAAGGEAGAGDYKTLLSFLSQAAGTMQLS